MSCSNNSFLTSTYTTHIVTDYILYVNTRACIHTHLHVHMDTRIHIPTYIMYTNIHSMYAHTRHTPTHGTHPYMAHTHTRHTPTHTHSRLPLRKLAPSATVVAQWGRRTVRCVGSVFSSWRDLALRITSFIARVSAAHHVTCN